MVDIIYSNKKIIDSYNKALNSVIKEKVYLANTEYVSIERTEKFVSMILDFSLPQFFAVYNNQVLGWCDIIPKLQEYFKHVGVLGMGVLNGHRGRGIGKVLLEKTLRYTKDFGLTKIELEVFESNRIARKLYASFGFITEGKLINRKKVEKEYENVILMGKIL